MIQLLLRCRRSYLSTLKLQSTHRIWLTLYWQTEISILGMTTRGDQIQDQSFAKIGGKWFFINGF